MARGMGPSRPGACGSWGTDAWLCDKEGLTLVTCLPQVCVMRVVQEARPSRGQTALKMFLVHIDSRDLLLTRGSQGRTSKVWATKKAGTEFCLWEICRLWREGWEEAPERGGRTVGEDEPAALLGTPRSASLPSGTTSTDLSGTVAGRGVFKAGMRTVSLSAARHAWAAACCLAPQPGPQGKARPHNWCPCEGHRADGPPGRDGRRGVHMDGQRGPCFWTLTLWRRVWPTPEAPVRCPGGGGPPAQLIWSVPGRLSPLNPKC